MSAAGLTLATCSSANAGQSSVIDFDTDIVPILTKAGCNSGACHGAAAGRGEFHLSLFGSDAAFDYDSIVREFRGRRVNIAHPSESLILTKPTEVLLHGGGTRLEYEGSAANLIQTWIEQGAVRSQRRQLEGFKVTTGATVLDAAPYSTTILATATFDDGQARNVTATTVFTPEDSSSVTIDDDSHVMTVHRPGQHVVIARYLDRVVPVMISRPRPNQSLLAENLIRRNLIDDPINALLTTLKIPTSGTADDATFQRRVTLDLIGRLPTIAEVQEFQTGVSITSRDQLVDRLLASEEFVDYWTYQFAQLLRIRSQPRDEVGARTYHAWLREQIQNGVPFDEIATALVLGQGDSHEVGPANFYRTVAGPREQAEFFSELFMGSRLRCANCHDHPLDHWTQNDYHGLAAIFAKVEQGRIIGIKETAEVIHPKTGEAAVPRIPGGRELANRGDDREQLVAWLTDSDNPYFAKAIVNRLWKSMMGRGLVEPTDDLRTTNPATHPELLAKLADEFISSDYQLRHLLRLIATSAAYSRSETVQSENAADDRFYSHALVRPLQPEVLADALADLTGISTTYGEEPVGTRAITLFDPNIPSAELDILGRCSREESCDGTAQMSGGLPRMLHQFNGGLLNSRLSGDGSRLEKMRSTSLSANEIVEEIYLRAYSRTPTEVEKRFWQNEFETIADPDQLQSALEDFLWSICTSTEFVTNH